VSESTSDNSPRFLVALRRIFALDERGRFILFFLLVNILIFILIWLLWKNHVLIQENIVLKTQVVIVAETRVFECEVDCTDRMSTAAARVAGTEVAYATNEALATRFPAPSTATPILTPPSTATGAPMPSPTLTSTSAPPPTPTSAPTQPPTPTDTPLAIPTYSPEPPPPSPPPVTTPPTVLGIVPTMVVKSAGPVFPITITGRNFSTSGVTAQLGANTGITITGITTTTISGALSPDIPVGVYGLTVFNSDCPDPVKLSPAFTVYATYGGSVPLESPYLVTFGRDAGSPYDTGYQEQVIRFAVPTTTEVSALYVRIFDADTGTGVDDHRGDDVYDTDMRYTLHGDTLSPTVTISKSLILNGGWSSLFGPFLASEGELAGNWYVFRLAVEGLRGSDANWYRVALSDVPHSNTVPSDVWMYADSLTLPLEDLLMAESQPLFHTYVGKGVDVFRLQTFGCRDVEGEISIRTPLRTLTTTCCVDSAVHEVGDDEDEATWAVDFGECSLPDGTAYLGFTIKDEHDQVLPIFTRPMMSVLLW